MMLRTYGAILAWALALSLTSPALGQPGSPPLRPGDVLPSVAGETLSGKPLDLPTAAQDRAAVVIFSFSRAGGRDAQNWAQHLAKDYPRLDIYNVIFLESVSRLFRGMAVSGIRSGMPPAVQDRSAIVYRLQSIWEQRLQVTNEADATVVVLGRAGSIRGMARGPFAESVYARIRAGVGP